MQKQIVTLSSFVVLLFSTLAAAAPAGSASDAERAVSASDTAPLIVARKKRDKTVTIDGVRYRDHGTRDVRGQSTLKLEVDNYYFEPTFLRGNPGQKLTLVIENEESTLHNFYVASLNIDKDIPPKGKLEVQLTFPDSGVLPFTCKYHSAIGMNGQLQSK